MIEVNMIWVELFLIIALSIIAGYYQGIVMSMKGDVTHTLEYEGARGHKHFKYTHAIWGAVIIGSMIIGHVLISQFVTTWEYLVTLCLVFLVAWFCFEPAYNYARYKSIVPPDKREHVVFADLFSLHAPSTLMHSIRLILIAVFIGIMVIAKRKE